MVSSMPISGLKWVNRVIKQIRTLALAVFLLLVVLSPAQLQAQSELVIIESSTSVQFPTSIGFSLAAESDDDIIDIRLHYTVEREAFAEVTSEVYIEFDPGTSVDVSWSLDLRRVGGLPLGTVVDYWWTVADAGGNQVATAPAQIRLDDNRYDWRSITEGDVTIYWYEGDESFAQELMTTAQAALERLAEDTGAHLKEAVGLYIYASTQDLQGSMIFPQEWTGGVAFTRYGTIAIGVAPDNLEWGKRAVIHELTHLVTHQMTFNPYGGLPTWLNEGLSMHAEGELEVIYQVYLIQAIAQGSLISVRSLASPFSAFPEQSYLSYAQSYSIVEFLIDEYGQESMLELLNTFQQGSSYDGALLRVYGFDMDGLNARWRDSLATAAPAEPIEWQMSPALIGLLAAMATLLALGLAILAEDWAWRRGR